MAWPKGQKRSDAFKQKNAIDKETPQRMTAEEFQHYKDSINKKTEMSLPITEKLSDVIQELKTVLRSYRHNIETKVVEESNVTTAITVTITFLTR